LGGGDFAIGLSCRRAVTPTDSARRHHLTRGSLLIISPESGKQASLLWEVCVCVCVKRGLEFSHFEFGETPHPHGCLKNDACFGHSYIPHSFTHV
jgi:hypothetical protein